MSKSIIVIIGIIILISGCSKEEISSQQSEIEIDAPILIAYSGTFPNVSAEIAVGYFGDINTVNAYGFCYSTSNPFPTISDDVLSLGIQIPQRTFSGSIDNIEAGDLYYVRGFINLGDIVLYSSDALILASPSLVNIDLNPIASLGNIRRTEAVAFSIGGKGYVGLGENPGAPTTFNDLWEYDPTNNIWTQKADYPVIRASTTSFVIDDIAYVGTGHDYTIIETNRAYRRNPTNDFYAYNPVMNQWDSIAPIPTAITGAIGLSIGSKGYVIGGADTLECLSTIYEYDAVTNRWTTKTPLPTTHCAGAGNTINGKAYIGMGYGEPAFYEFDPTNNTVNTLQSYPGNPMGDLISFMHENEIYFGFGMDTDKLLGTYSQDYWKFNPIEKKWFQVSLLRDKVSAKENLDFSEAVSFKVGEKVFIGSGQVSVIFEDGERGQSQGSSEFYEVLFDQ